MDLFNCGLDFPSEILCQIIINADYLALHALLSLNKTTNKLALMIVKDFTKYVYDIVKYKTKLNINNFNAKQLWHLNIVCDTQIMCHLHNDTTLILKDDILYYNDPKSDKSTEKIMENLNNIIQIDSNSFNKYVLDNKGSVYLVGTEDDPTFKITYLSKLLNLPDNIIQISIGNREQLILTSGGKVYSIILCNGSEFGGPILIEELNNITHISCKGSEHIAITHDGLIFARVLDLVIAMKLDIPYDSTKYIKIEKYKDIINACTSNDHTLLLDKHGNVHSFGSSNLGYKYPQEKLILRNIIQISAGNQTSLCLSNNGRVYSFGINENNALGHEYIYEVQQPRLIYNLNNIIYVRSSTERSLFINTNYDIYQTWKHNLFRFKKIIL